MQKYPDILVIRVDDRLKKDLTEKAKQNNRSRNEEARLGLRAHVSRKHAPTDTLEAAGRT